MNKCPDIRLRREKSVFPQKWTRALLLLLGGSCSLGSVFFGANSRDRPVTVKGRNFPDRRQGEKLTDREHTCFNVGHELMRLEARACENTSGLAAPAPVTVLGAADVLTLVWTGGPDQ